MEQLLFIKNGVKDFYRVGAVAPSSRFLAERMARATLPAGRQVSMNNDQTIVELGAGTGAITKELLKILPTQGRLTILEINPDFVSFLEKNFKDQRMVCYAKSAENLPKIFGKNSADAIVSSLPLGNFGTYYSKKIILGAKDCLKPNGIFVQFQYSLKSWRLLKKTFRQVNICFEPRNIWPAFIYICRK
ncbi:MAG: methyltransferase domain-containing protein [Candidatus Paceibacterota bacterium]|jgi:phospholipid N-methyltransferase